MQSFKNKTGNTEIQSRTVGQEQLCENRSEFKNVTDGRTYLPTDRPTDRHGKEYSRVYVTNLAKTIKLDLTVTIIIFNERPLFGLS